MLRYSICIQIMKHLKNAQNVFLLFLFWMDLFLQKMDKNRDGVVTIEEFIETCQKVNFWFGATHRFCTFTNFIRSDGVILTEDLTYFFSILLSSCSHFILTLYHAVRALSLLYKQSFYQLLVIFSDLFIF